MIQKKIERKNELKYDPNIINTRFEKNILKDSKLNFKILQKPFFSVFSGNGNDIISLNCHPSISNLFFSGYSDGDIRFWLTHRKKNIFVFKGHQKKVNDLCTDFKGKELLSCSEDGTVGKWNIINPKKKGKLFFLKNGNFKSIKAYPFDTFFATGGKEILLWDQETFRPIQRLIWGVNIISKIAFNFCESNLLSSLCSDRSIILYDLRIKNPIKKIFMDMLNNDLSWNRGVSSEFTVANEDSNIYTFDMRNMIRAKKIYREHLMAVNCINHSDKGDLFVTGSSDTTARVFEKRSGRSIDRFFSERMKRVTGVKFLLDGNFFLTGSDDGDIRIWNKKNSTQEEKRDLNGHFSRFKRINETGYNFFPKRIKNLQHLKKILIVKKKNKDINIKKHFLPGFLKFDT